MSEPFIELSRALTGEANLDPRLADHYEYRLREYFGKTFDLLLEEFKKRCGSGDAEQAAKKTLADEAAFHKVAREIIRAWYTGQFQTPYEDTEPPREVAHYEQGLLWRVIRTHAPGFTNAGYGAWAKPPAKERHGT